MREIKFRGKRVNNDKWVHGYLVKDTDGGMQFPCNLQITYLNGCFMIGNCTTHEFYRLYQQDFEIIGNAHEHPNLLGGAANV